MINQTGDHFWLFEKILMMGILLFLVLLLIVQFLLLSPVIGMHLNFALRLEGKPLSTENQLAQTGGVSLAPWANLTMQLPDYVSRPDVVISLNGEEISNFLRREVSLNVSKGDLVMINNPQKELPLRVVISKKTPNIVFPDIDALFEGNERIYFSIKMK